jgi:DNA repair photolyase
MTKELVIASLYKKRDIWYISSMIDNKRLSVSLRTKDKRVAKRLEPKAGLELLRLCIIMTSD